MAESNSKSRWPAYRRVPPFLPVPGRFREDGWTPMRQAQFIGYLTESGSVTEAARRVGISRMSAYRLRRGIEAESFAHAWDEVLAVVRAIQVPLRKVTYGELYEWRWAARSPSTCGAGGSPGRGRNPAIVRLSSISGGLPRTG